MVWLRATAKDVANAHRNRFGYGPSSTLNLRKDIGITIYWIGEKVLRTRRTLYTSRKERNDIRQIAK